VPLIAPRERVATLPRDLDAICRRCLEKQPEHRYASARALAEDLGRFLDGREVSARALGHWQRGARWARREPQIAMAITIAVVALVLGLAVSLGQWQRAESGAQRVRTLLWQQRSDEAQARWQADRPLEALPGLVQNLAEQEAVGARDAADLSRWRIGSVLAAGPQLVDVIATGDALLHVLLDPDGAGVVTSGGDGELQRFDVRNGTHLWELSRTHLGPMFATAGDNLQLKAIAGSRRILVEQAFEADSPRQGWNSALVELDTGHVVLPPTDRFPRLTGMHFSHDGSHALVVGPGPDAASQAQLVRVADWQALGPARDFVGLALVASDGSWFASVDPLARMTSGRAVTAPRCAGRSPTAGR
jgi:hypothetical protein